MKIESNWFHGLSESKERVPIKAVIFDKDLTLTEEAIGREKGGITLKADTLFWTERIKLVPGVLPFIQELRALGLRTGLLTNDTREATDEVLRRFRLMDHFDATVARKEVDGFKKPHPAPFLHMAHLLAVEPAHCVMIGDEPSDDIEGAKNAGMRAILVPRTGHVEESGWWKTEPDLVLLNRQGLNVQNLMQL